MLLLLPVNPNSFLPLISFSFKLGKGFRIITDPSFRFENGSNCVVCLGPGLHVSYRQAKIFNPVIALTVFVKHFTIDLLFCTDVQTGSIVLNDKEGEV